MKANEGTEQGGAGYVPDSIRAGGEARGEALPASSAKLYIPQSLQQGERVRGWYQYVFTMQSDSPVFREFAERAKFVIGPEQGDRRELARQFGRPEFERIPVTYWGHSAGGNPAWQKAVDPGNIMSSLAVIGHHSLIYRAATERGPRPTAGHAPGPMVTLLPDVVAGDPRGEIPVWADAGSRDRHQALVNPLLQTSAKVSELGWKWTFVLGHGESHQGNEFEKLKLNMLWLEEVAALRIIGEIPADGAVVLQNIDESEGWVGYLELLPPVWFDEGASWWRVARAAIYPYSEAPGKGAVDFDDGRVGGYMWLPSERFAEAWLNYHLTTTGSGDPSPRHMNTWWAGLTDTVEERIGWGLFENDWCHVFFSMLNIPDFAGDFENVHWESVGPLPDGLVLHPNGRMMTKGIQPGTYRFRLRASYGGQAWEDDYYIGLRNSEDDSPLTLTVESPLPNATVDLPFRIAWSSTLPLGILEYHSSLDGQLGTAFGELGVTGSIDLPNLSPGNHLITLLVYSSAPTVQRQARSFFITVEAEDDQPARNP